MRKITSLLLLLLCAVTVLSARENKYDRGIVMKTFIPKGQWMVGATFSYSEHVDDNFEFMSLLKDIDSEGYTFKVTPLVSYFIRDNISIGGRLAYSRSYTKLDNLSLSLGDDISLDINEWNDKSNTYSAAFFIVRARMMLSTTSSTAMATASSTSEVSRLPLAPRKACAMPVMT